jgi:hypothetical protein
MMRNIGSVVSVADPVPAAFHPLWSPAAELQPCRLAAQRTLRNIRSAFSVAAAALFAAAFTSMGPGDEVRPERGDPVRFELAGANGVFTADALGRRLQNAEGHYLEFGVPQLHCPGDGWESRPIAPRSAPGKIVYDYGKWGESYLQNNGSVHQVFMIKEQPRGEARLRIPLTTDRRPSEYMYGFEFVGDDGGGFTVTRPTLLDSAGLIVELPTRASAQGMEVTLSADLMAGAKFPILIDPLIGTRPTAIANAGNSWRHKPISIVWDAGDGVTASSAFYMVAWHENVQHNQLNYVGINTALVTKADVRMRAMRVNTALSLDNQIQIGEPFGIVPTPVEFDIPRAIFDWDMDGVVGEDGIYDPILIGCGPIFPGFRGDQDGDGLIDEDPPTLDPVDGLPLQIQVSPAVTFNPYAGTFPTANGRYMITWCEYNTLTHPWRDNCPPMAGSTHYGPVYNDSFGRQSAVLAQRFDVNPATGAIVLRGTPTLVAGGSTTDNDGDGRFNEDPVNFDAFGFPIDDDGDGLFNEDGPEGLLAVDFPVMFVDVTHESPVTGNYLIVWQETSSAVFGRTLGVSADLYTTDIWWAKVRPWSRRLNDDGTPDGFPTALSDEKYRVYLGQAPGPFSVAIAMTSAGVPLAYNVSEFVPIDMVPRCASIIWWGPDKIMYTADDGAGDGVDDDGDGSIDDDGDGQFDEDPVDGTDNDMDGLIDEDPPNPPIADEETYNAIDDDGDGLIDEDLNQFRDGSLVVWGLSSLIFNVPKSRIRARFIPSGQPADALDTIVFDVFNADGQFYGRPDVTACFSKLADNTGTPTLNETFNTSFFAVVFQSLEDLAFEGTRAVELFGSIYLRITEEDGYPTGPPITVAAKGTNDKYLWPSVAYGYESEQVYISYCRTDGTLFNPVTRARVYYPKAFSFLDTSTNVFDQPLVPLATLYPVAAHCSFNSGVIDGTNASTTAAANHHIMSVAVEDDFSASAARRYRFPQTPVVGYPVIFVNTAEPTASGPRPDTDPLPPNMTLNFSTPVSTSPPPSQTILVGNAAPLDPASYLLYTVDSDQAWLAINGGTTYSNTNPLTPGKSDSLVVSIDSASLSDGCYTGHLTVSSALATNSPMIIDVKLEVGPAGSCINGLNMAPASLTFSGVIGTSDPADQSISVTFEAASVGQLADWTLAQTYISPTGSAWASIVAPAAGGLVGRPNALTVDKADDGDGTGTTVTFHVNMSDAGLSAAGAGTYTANFTLYSPIAGGRGLTMGNMTDNPVNVNTTTLVLTLNATVPVLSETPGTDCADGTDNDGDGSADCADSDCNPADPICGPETASDSNCADGIDNDGDGEVDCGDPECSTATNCAGGPGPGPGPSSGGGGGGASGCLSSGLPAGTRHGALLLTALAALLAAAALRKR